MIVVDASLGVKWFLDEAGSDQATDVLVANRRQIAVPDLFAIEVASALVRECNIHKEESSHYSWALARLFALLEGGAVDQQQTGHNDLSAAVNIATDIGHPLKDCVYLVLAMNLDCELFTSDRRFANKASEVWSRIQVIPSETAIAP